MRNSTSLLCLCLCLVNPCLAQHGQQQLLISQKIASGGGGTWTLIQDVSTLSNASPSTATISVGAGHLLVIATNFDGTGAGTEAVASVTAGFCSGSWQMPAGLSSFNVNGGTVGGAYCLVSAAQTGAAISIAFSGGHAFNFYPRLLEYAWSGSTVALDGTASSADRSAASASQAGASVTTSGTADVCVQWIRANQNTTAISGTYTNPADLNAGSANGWAGAINISSTGTQQPTWTLAGSGTAAVAGLCFSGT